MHLKIGKAVALGLWVAVLLALLGMFPASVTQLLLTVGVATAVIHVLEVSVFLLRHRELSDNVMADAAQVMVFGVFHLSVIGRRAQDHTDV